MALVTGIINEGIIKVITTGALIFLPADILKAAAAVFTAAAIKRGGMLKDF